MPPPGLLGLSDVEVGAAIGVPWLLILVATLYRYRRGTLEPPKAAIMVSAAAFWLGYAFLRIGDGVSGTAEILVGLLALGCLAAGVVAGYRWWTTRDARAA